MVTPRFNESQRGSINGVFSRSFTVNWEVIIFLVILVAAIVTRFAVLGDRVMSHDESLHTRFSYNLSHEGNFQHSPLMHGPILFHVNALMYTLFGDNDFTSRIYPAFFSVLLVMTPLLFRQWLGRWGAILASIMLLISPLLLYYGRYIRHDIPSILAAVLMVWSIMMYLGGPDSQKRRPYWLYILSAAMLWNLGSKETSFIYIFLIGVFLFGYFVIRLIQHFRNIPGRPILDTTVMGMLLGGVLSMGMFIVLDVIKFDLLKSTETTAFSALPVGDQGTFFLWTFLVIASVIGMVVATALWAYRGRVMNLPWLRIVTVLLIALIVMLGFVVLEELSHTEAVSTQPVAPLDPDAEGEGAGVTSLIRWTPMILVWMVAIVGFVLLFITRRKETWDGSIEKDKLGSGLWGTLDLFPEFDLIVVIGTLILPWATAFIPYLMKGTQGDLVNVANSLPSFVVSTIGTYVPQIGAPGSMTQEQLAQVGQFWLHFIAWLPLMGLAIAIGLVWNWRRWLIASTIFHLLFAFFFTTVFTNVVGLATGMIYSLGYWLEQQGVRRGSQPQYYYLLVIMPFYEFLPVIGSILAMLAGTTVFWRRRMQHTQAESDIASAVLLADVQSDTDRELADAEIVERVSTYNQNLESSDSEIQQPVSLVRLERALAIRRSQYLDGIPFLLFFSWLGVFNLVGYSLAGEKMPWLGTHLTMPLIFLTAWFFGRIIEGIDKETFSKRGWIAGIVIILAIIGLFRTISPLIMGTTRPFSGLAQHQLQATYNWLTSVIVTGGAVGVLVYFSDSLLVGWRQIRQLVAVAVFIILSVITFRSGFMASFINYDYPTEFLVYAHAAPGVKWVLEDIEELSLRTTDGNDIRIAYDNEVSWPYSWYFRNFDNVTYVGENPTVQNLDDAVVVVVGSANRSKVEPILEERYFRFDHMRLWWPMQDYFNLTTTRINTLLDFSPSNVEAAQTRQGMFDIWWNRDYTVYGSVKQRDFTLENWPVSDRMHFYVRKDIASQIWEYGIGEGEIVNPLNEIEENICTANWQDLTALTSFEAPDGMTNSLGISVDAGVLYVAEEFGHRISRFSTDGTYLDSFGQNGLTVEDGVALTRPNSVAIGPTGNIYVADTWNYRIQVLSPELDLITMWGQAHTGGFDAMPQPVDGFWGPRDVVVDDSGRVYVSDTGNKRVRVYDVIDGAGVHLFDIGSGGSGIGELDEPSGLAIHPDGRLYVADTWNRRISVFTTDGAFLDTYRVRGWYEELGNRPYLAIDPARELLYVTDPDGGRVLVYTTGGDCVGSFGQAAGTVPTLGQFGVASGIAVDDDGFVYIADSQLGRVLKFQPFEFAPPAAQDDAVEAESDELIEGENAEAGGASE